MKILLSVIFFLVAALQINAQQFRFVVLGDSQFENPEVFKKVVSETELLKPAFVLHVGDMIHGYTYDEKTAEQQWKRFKKQISPLTMPFYPTPGNHDVTTKEIQPAYIKTWGKDKLYYSFNYKNSHFIVLNVFLDQQFDTIPENELEWLKKDLEKNKSVENIFLTMHSPLYMNSKYDWKPIQKLLEKYNVKAIFSGHYHIYDYRKIGKISYFNLNSSGRMNIDDFFAGYSHGFMFVTVNGSKIDYAFINQQGIFPIDTVKTGESGKSPRYFDEDKTVLIPDPSKQPTNISVSCPIRNNTNQKRQYELTWETDNYNWKFTPWGKNIEVPANSTVNVNFKIDGPKGNFLRDELPKLRVKSVYVNQRGEVSPSVYYFHLFSPPSVSAKYTNAKINVDGKVNEDVWTNQHGINQLYIDTKNTPAQTNTDVKLVYDDSCLYVSLVGGEPKPENLSAKAYGDIPLVFGDDDFELFFDTNHDQKSFYRLMVNPKGTILCSSPKGLFSFKFDVKTYVGKNFWSAEFKIPFSELNLTKPKAGTVWGFQVRRHRLQSSPQQSDWSIMNYYLPYQPEYFGLLKFE